MAENAAMDDGKLDLYFIYPGRFWQLIASVTHLKFGLARPDVLKRLSAITVALRTTGRGRSMPMASLQPKRRQNSDCCLRR